MFMNLNIWKYWDKNNISVTAKYVVCNVCVSPFIDGMLAWWINEASLQTFTAERTDAAVKHVGFGSLTLNQPVFQRGVQIHLY